MRSTDQHLQRLHLGACWRRRSGPSPGLGSHGLHSQRVPAGPVLAEVGQRRSGLLRTLSASADLLLPNCCTFLPSIVSVQLYDFEKIYQFHNCYHNLVLEHEGLFLNLILCKFQLCPMNNFSRSAVNIVLLVNNLVLCTSTFLRVDLVLCVLTTKTKTKARKETLGGDGCVCYLLVVMVSRCMRMSKLIKCVPIKCAVPCISIISQ